MSLILLNNVSQLLNGKIMFYTELWCSKMYFYPNLCGFNIKYI